MFPFCSYYVIAIVVFHVIFFSTFPKQHRPRNESNRWKTGCYDINAVYEIHFFSELIEVD